MWSTLIVRVRSIQPCGLCCVSVKYGGNAVSCAGVCWAIVCDAAQLYCRTTGTRRGAVTLSRSFRPHDTSDSANKATTISVSAVYFVAWHSGMWIAIWRSGRHPVWQRKTWVDLPCGPKKWHTFGIWVSYPIRCTIIAILIYLRVIVIKWRHYYVVFRLPM